MSESFPRSLLATVLAACVSAAAVLAQQPAPPASAASSATDGVQAPRVRAIYDALRASRPDGRTVEVAGLEIKRNAFTFRFDGTFHLLAPVESATFGAVFLGRGAFRLEPTSEGEKQHLARVSGGGAAQHEDTFEEMVLLFLDGTDLDLAAEGKVGTGPPSPAATASYQRFLQVQREQLHINFQLRLLEELVNDSAWQRGVFLAFFDGARTPPALAAVDPRGCDALRMTSNWSRERAFFVVKDANDVHFWYASDPRKLPPGAARVNAPDWADAEHYEILTHIDGDRVYGLAIIRLKSQVPRLEALPVHLLPSLRIIGVEMRRPSAGDAWTAGAFVQEAAREDPDATLLLPHALSKDEVAEIKVEYAGDRVLEPMGDNVFAVGARTIWYPNLGPFRDLATYRLTFNLPLGLQVVATGREVEARDADQRHEQVWESKTPIRVTGFNYGNFDALVERDASTSTELAIYTTKGRPEVLDYIEAALRSGNRPGDASDTGGNLTPQEEAVAALGRPGLVGSIDPSQLARSALVDAMNAGRIASSYFGPLPLDRVAITQQSQWSFGQSWPGLIFMPYLAFLANMHRMQIGELMPRGFFSDAQIEQIGYHEYAHQWWGHLVGWESYRDVWISEGFAEFTAGLVAEHAKGRAAADTFWANARDAIVITPRGAKIANYKAGPVSMGHRLSAKDNPSAPNAIVYSKGAYILHMLRMLMWENQSERPDQRFAAMMLDFVQAHAGKTATNADFEAVVKRHMTPQMDAAGDGTMDWFFEQWLYGTEIPSFRNHLTVERVAGDEYRIAGTVEQLGVSADFRTFMPLYLDFGKDGMARLGGVRLVGTGPLDVDIKLKLPAKPKRVVLNAHHDVLALDVK